MGSTRLPGKSLAMLGDQPVIDWVVERVSMATSVSEVIVATSTNTEDDVLVERVDEHGVATVWRGSPEDVLARYAGAVQTTTRDIVVRVTGDCPFVQPELIDMAIDALPDHDHVATNADGRFPRGFDVEAMTRRALLIADSEAVDPVEREHVTPFIVRRPERFRSVALECPEWARRPEFRLTLDEVEDLTFLRAVVDELDATPMTLRGRDVTALLDIRPDLVSINADVTHRVIR